MRYRVYSEYLHSRSHQITPRNRLFVVPSIRVYVIVHGMKAVSTNDRFLCIVIPSFHPLFPRGVSLVQELILIISHALVLASQPPKRPCALRLKFSAYLTLGPHEAIRVRRVDVLMHFHSGV